MPEPSVTHRPEKGSASGIFELEGDGKRLGYLEYSLPDGDTVCIDYVEVDRALRGRRMGNRLVDAAVAWARTEKRNVTATCSFARAVLSQMKM
jgi:predicted GNAT family acetyltransferase